MKYRVLGKTSLKISEIGFGGWAIGGNWGDQNENDSIDALHKALDLGVNFIDTAAGYGNGKSEQIIARVLKERKENVYVATKIPPTEGVWPPSPYCLSEERYPESYLRKNLEERLKFLNTDCIDLVQLHTWTRAWNKNPKPLEILQKFKKEGKIKYVGISTPEHDQNCVIDLMRSGLLDAAQVIYNIFDQEPAAELLPVANETNVGIIVRVVFDEGALTGKFTAETKFQEDDFRNGYFAGDRLSRTIKKVNEIKNEIKDSGLTLPQVAIKFALAHPAVSTVIPGIRNTRQAELNTAVSDLPGLSEELLKKLQKYNWRKAIWYGGK
ncbi:MAG: aldo/keto reductase [Bacteroidales bacterium]|nr:aldo/keto reductase [Bacteroidales bacterium]